MSLLDRRIRGFRLVDMMALGLLIALVLAVYLAKTIAGRERSEIASVEHQIAAEHERIRLLEAEVSHLEQPSRIEQLSVDYLKMAPLDARHETTPEALATVAQPAQAAPKKAPVL
jgi:hypothetical protein